MSQKKAKQNRQEKRACMRSFLIPSADHLYQRLANLSEAFIFFGPVRHLGQQHLFNRTNLTQDALLHVPLGGLTRHPSEVLAHQIRNSQRSEKYLDGGVNGAEMITAPATPRR